MFMLSVGIAAMGLTVFVSNILVEHPVQAVLAGIDLSQWLTYGAFTYPIAFLVTDMTNRVRGPRAARSVVLTGFAVAVVLSLLWADPRIAVASGTAFLIAQMMDVTVFDRLRRATWWKAPALSSLMGSALDTLLFFSIAFLGTGVPWPSLALGDFGVKVLMVLTLLAPYRVLMMLIRPWQVPHPARG